VVRDEPEQDGGLWIGQPHARLPLKQAAARGIELERAEALHDRSGTHAVRADYRVPHARWNANARETLHVVHARRRRKK